MKKTVVASPIPLSYWRAALAEVSLCHPEVPADDKPIGIEEQDGRWFVSEAAPNVSDWVRKQFATSKAGNGVDGKSPKTIPYVLVAARLSAQASHGIKAEAAEINQGDSLLCIPCLLDRQGSLLPDPDRHPWIPRDMLEPSLKEITIGDLESYDKFLSSIPGKPTSFNDTLRIAVQMFKAVTETTLPLVAAYLEEGNAPPTYEREGYQVASTWHGIAYDPPIVARHLIKLYDQLIRETPEIPLLNRLRNTADVQTRQPISIPDADPYSKASVGHVDRKHALSPSQHEAMAELAALKNGHVLAVNGPPGTGKTTLLQSVVAQLWVEAALQKAACPLIVTTSTNVKAVENVLDSFGKIGATIGHQRWILYNGGFGLFMASNSRETTFPVCTSDTHPFVEFETVEAIDSARKYYLNQAGQYFGNVQDSVNTVVNTLHAELTSLFKVLQKIIKVRYAIFSDTGKDANEGAIKSCTRLISKHESEVEAEKILIESCDHMITRSVEAVKSVEGSYGIIRTQIDSSERKWSAYLAETPLWLDLLSFIPPVMRRRNASDRAFLLSDPLTVNLYHRQEDVPGLFTSLRKKAHMDKQAQLKQWSVIRDQAEENKTLAKGRFTVALNELTKFKKLLQSWHVAVGANFKALSDTSVNSLNDHLDLLIRAPMFVITDRYWSGMWLLEMTERQSTQAKDTKGRDKLELKYRRFAKLAPCFVSNFHMAPSFFTAWQGVDIPLWNTIDLLVVDEAGQVSPDIGVAMFALAKRALVVGDTFQIEPVWNIGEATDRSNAVKFGLITQSGDSRYDKLAIEGYTAANGNLMQIAGRGCAVQKYDDIRGLLLTEHRRCVPELVEYCNSLVYAGRLLPLRPALDARNRLFPAYGTLDVQGRDKKIGTSRQNYEEAQAIVKWLKDNRPKIENHYRDKDSGEPIPVWKSVGIITPFSIQAALIEQLIRKAMPELARKGSRLTVGTVHALQGAEREIVIFSPTYGTGHTGGMFFDKSPNMLNVAVSRAKDSFLVIGNLTIFDQTKKSKPSGLLATFMTNPEKSGLI